MKQTIMERMANLPLRRDENYGDFPTYEEINRDYKEVVELFNNVRTVEAAAEIHSHGIVNVEINGRKVDELPSDFTDSDIEWFGCDSYGCLSYVHMLLREDGGMEMSFDVWAHAMDSSFIYDVAGDINGNWLTEEQYQYILEEAKEKVMATV